MMQPNLTKSSYGAVLSFLLLFLSSHMLDFWSLDCCFFWFGSFALAKPRMVLCFSRDLGAGFIDSGAVLLFLLAFP